MESVISADDCRRRCEDMGGSAQWEIKIVTDEHDHEHDPETETMTQSEVGPPSPQRSRNASRSSNRSRKGRGKAKGKGRSRARKGYASVDPAEAEADAADAMDEREHQTGSTLQILNFPSFKSSVSPPSKSHSLLNKKVSLKDVRPAFYVPGMSSLSSPPLPPQPQQQRLDMLPKPRERTKGRALAQEAEHLAEDHESVAPSSMVTALSEVSASTRLSEHRRNDTNLSEAWNDCDDDDEQEDAKLCGAQRDISAASGTSVDL